MEIPRRYKLGILTKMMEARESEPDVPILNVFKKKKKHIRTIFKLSVSWLLNIGDTLELKSTLITYTCK